MRPDPIDPLIFTININDMLEDADSTFNVQVQEFDIIFVPPTLLAELADFIKDLIYPFTEVLREVSGALFGYQRGYGRSGRNNRNNNTFGF